MAKLVVCVYLRKIFVVLGLFVVLFFSNVLMVNKAINKKGLRKKLIISYRRIKVNIFVR